MLRKSLFLAFAATAALTLHGALQGPGTALAAPASLARTAETGRYLPVRRTTIAPFSFARFCADHSDQCRARGSDAPIDMTPARHEQLRRINTAVNRAIRYEEDAPGDDVWRIGVSAGDCEDYVLEKRRRLLAAGWPSSALRIAVAKTRDGTGHAVLVVSTKDTDLVLDNRSNTIRKWNRTDLVWIKIQSTENPKKWLAF